MTQPTAEQERVAIVAYAQRRAVEWDAATRYYRARGNDGPYLGEPSWREFASAIERGEHHAHKTAHSPLTDPRFDLGV